MIILIYNCVTESRYVFLFIYESARYGYISTYVYNAQYSI